MRSNATVATAVILASCLAQGGALAGTQSAQSGKADPGTPSAQSAATGQSAGTDPMASCPMHAEHMRAKADSAHHDAVDARGDAAMGFSHAKTTHHFRLYADGGAIDVSANDAADAESRDQIRGHLALIARAFSEGHFDTPMAVHDRVPPGVPAMERLKANITYVYEETDRGGRVRIAALGAEALGAVHDFLRFQIEDHRTGDPLEVQPER